MFIFYFRGQTEVVDTIMAFSSAHEAVFDCYILCRGKRCPCSISLYGADILRYMGFTWNEFYSCCLKGPRAARLTGQF